MLFKALSSIVIVFVLVLIAGLSGLSYRVWPTGFNDYKLTVTPEVLQRLRSLQSERKFGPDSESEIHVRVVFDGFPPRTSVFFKLERCDSPAYVKHDNDEVAVFQRLGQ